MKLEILPRGVLSEPIVIDASLVVIRLDDTTPIMVVGSKMVATPGGIAAVAGDYGPDGAVRAAHALDSDFNETLKALGINRSVVCDRLVLPPPPPGARLIRGK